MVNCAHPTHFSGKLANEEAWLHRIGSIRANVSCKSDTELDAFTTLDKCNPIAQCECAWCGCCGTGHNHILAIHQQCEHYFDAA